MLRATIQSSRIFYGPAILDNHPFRIFSITHCQIGRSGLRGFSAQLDKGHSILKITVGRVSQATRRTSGTASVSPKTFNHLQRSVRVRIIFLSAMTQDINEKRKSFEKEAVVHSDGLYRTALRMTRNEDDAADLVQEAMVKAYRFWDKYEEGSNARAWLYKIMTNIFINNYRSKTRAPQMVAYEDIDENFLYGQLAKLGHESDPEQEFFARVFDDDVRKAIEELPEDFRLVVVLSFLEGFSYQEIANIAGLNIGTVKSRLHRGRKLLQKSLWDYARRSGFLTGERGGDA